MFPVFNLHGRRLHICNLCRLKSVYSTPVTRGKNLPLPFEQFIWYSAGSWAEQTIEHMWIWKIWACQLKTSGQNCHRHNKSFGMDFSFHFVSSRFENFQTRNHFTARSLWIKIIWQSPVMLYILIQCVGCLRKSTFYAFITISRWLIECGAGENGTIRPKTLSDDVNKIIFGYVDFVSHL